MGSIVGIGDSVTAATACDCRGFVSALAEARTTTHRSWHSVNLGTSGATAKDVAAQLAHAVSPDIVNADVILVTVGANDLLPALGRWEDGPCRPGCPAPETRGALSAVAQIVHRIQGVTQGRAQIFVLGYWNVFPDGSVGLSRFGPLYPAWSDGITRSYDAGLLALCQQAKVRYVDLYRPFKGDGQDADDGLLAADGDHPDAAGHAVITRALLAAGAAA